MGGSFRAVDQGGPKLLPVPEARGPATGCEIILAGATAFHFGEWIGFFEPTRVVSVTIGACPLIGGGP